MDSLADAEGWGAMYTQAADEQAARNATRVDGVGEGPGWFDWLSDQWTSLTGTAGTGQVPNTLKRPGVIERVPPLALAAVAGAVVFFAVRAYK